MKKILNMSLLKSQQLTVDVRSLNVYVLFLNTHSPEILNLKKEIKKKNLIFVKIDAV